MRHRTVPSCGRQSNREARNSDGSTARQLCKLTDDPNVELKRIRAPPSIKKLLVHERQSETNVWPNGPGDYRVSQRQGVADHQKTLRRITKLRFN